MEKVTTESDGGDAQPRMSPSLAIPVRGREFLEGSGESFDGRRFQLVGAQRVLPCKNALVCFGLETCVSR